MIKLTSTPIDVIQLYTMFASCSTIRERAHPSNVVFIYTQAALSIAIAVELMIASRLCYTSNDITFALYTGLISKSCSIALNNIG